MSRGHHVLFEKRNWSAHRPNRELRAKPGLIIPIEGAAHNALHREIATVPSPSFLLGSTVLSLYKDNPDDHLRSLDNLLFALEGAIELPRVKDIEYKLGELIIESVEAQKVFIKEGLK